MVWYFKQVEELKQKQAVDKLITEEEIGKLEEYVQRKKQFYDKPGNYKKHLLNAEELLKDIRTGEN